MFVSYIFLLYVFRLLCPRFFNFRKDQSFRIFFYSLLVGYQLSEPTDWFCCYSLYEILHVVQNDVVQKRKHHVLQSPIRYDIRRPMLSTTGIEQERESHFMFKGERDSGDCNFDRDTWFGSFGSGTREMSIWRAMIREVYEENQAVIWSECPKLAKKMYPRPNHAAMWPLWRSFACFREPWS